MASTTAAPQVIVIGIDGASWNLLDHMFDAGELPCMKELVATGTSGSLESTVPPTSPPAWTSFITGRHPSRHGIFSWWRAVNHEFTPVSSRDVMGRTLWEHLGENGRTVGIVNVPMTYPLPDHPVNGFMITGMLTPSVESSFTYPESLGDELFDLVGDYIFHVPWTEYERRRDGRQALLRDLSAKLDQRRVVALSLLDRYEVTFFMIVLAGNDRLCHCLWDQTGVDSPLRGRAEDQDVASMVRAYYRQLDATVRDILERRGPNTSVFLISDHGFGPLRREVFVNRWLADEGFLEPLQETPADRGRTLARSLARRLGFTESRLQALLGIRGAELAQRLTSTIRIDWSRTVAYSNGGNTIQINLRGREPHGIVQPGAEYGDTMSRVCARLAELRDPMTGHPPVQAIVTRADLPSGPHSEHCPDIVMLMSDEGYGAYGLDVRVASVFSTPTWRTGAHRMEGILVAAGEHIKPNAKMAGARVIDVAPTILYLMGLSIPRDMDGRILVDLFDPEFVNSRPPTTVGPPPASTKDRDAHANTGYEEVARTRLRGLGYID